MKYIRTNDGIYKTRQCYPEETLFENVTYVYRHEFVKNKDIIDQADTIEDLCDCYSYDTETVKDISVACSWKRCDTDREIFGCIKTNKGLIYVAKLNANGELELL